MFILLFVSKKNFNRQNARLYYWVEKSAWLVTLQRKYKYSLGEKKI